MSDSPIDDIKELVLAKPQVPAAIALLIILITFVILNRSKIFVKREEDFIIVGPKSSGKTNLFSILTTGKLPKLTVSSIEPSHDKLELGFEGHQLIGSYGIYDFPSASKLKSLYLYPHLQKNLNNIKGIIYMVDASNFNAEYCHEVASELIDILEITETLPNGVDVGIFCNKCDLFTSKKKLKVRRMLEEQVSKLYDLRLKSLSKVSKEGANEEDDDSETTGLVNSETLSSSFNNGNFLFALLEGNVDFLEGNIFKGKYEEVTNWIHEKAVN
ncbi:unnamed protein product [Ambrosiozyma monospora]|uniref:Unnamed protein product n=1 Tax=Ambrosiozyma monospora TaxID=43982 RepID=A0ACB5SVU4_AMBMO|nr:unnamed protein product [Ambrosiozyma monospora]